MILIAISYGVVVYVEWRYLQRNKRRLQTRGLVIMMACILTLCIEAIYLFKESWR